LRTRKIGLGVMGFADALILMGIRYDSEQAVDFARKLFRFIQNHAHKASSDLAKERGNFPNWQGSVWDTEFSMPMRNASVTTIAPTGSISILAGCSSGIEPVYSFAYKRRALDGREFTYVHPVVERIGHHEGWMNEKVAAALLEGVPASEIKTIPQGRSDVLVAAHDVPPEQHVRVQAAFQEYSDSGVSKTVNLPVTATVGDVSKVFQLAHELSCKGVTVYVDGSRPRQVLSTREKRLPVNLQEPRQRPRVTTGRTSKHRMGCGSLFVTVNRDVNGLCEVFANLGKAGGCPSQSEATCRAISVGLRSGIDPRVFVEQLKGIRCLSTCVARKGNRDVAVLSCPDAIARAIEESLGSGQTAPSIRTGTPCPECGSPLRKEEGCFVCTCGYSKCS